MRGGVTKVLKYLVVSDWLQWYVPAVLACQTELRSRPNDDTRVRGGSCDMVACWQRG